MRLYVSPFSFILSNFHYRGNFSSFHGICSFDVSSTKENTNYTRVCRLLVDVGSHVLRVTFDKIRPAGGLDTVLGSPSITATLHSLRRKKISSDDGYNKVLTNQSAAFLLSTNQNRAFHPCDLCDVTLPIFGHKIHVTP